MILASVTFAGSMGQLAVHAPRGISWSACAQEEFRCFPPTWLSARWVANVLPVRCAISCLCAGFATVMPVCCGMAVLWALIRSCLCLDLLPSSCHFGCSAPVHFSWPLGGSQLSGAVAFQFFGMPHPGNMSAEEMWYGCIGKQLAVAKLVSWGIA